MPFKKTLPKAPSSLPTSPARESPSSSISAPTSPYHSRGLTTRVKRQTSPSSASFSEFASATALQDRSPSVEARLDLPQLRSHFESVQTQAQVQVDIKPMKKGTKKEKQRNVVAAFSAYFGEQSRLENWQKFCRDLGIGLNERELTSISQCRKALIPIWVNIHDFLDARAVGEFPRKFTGEKALAKYTRDTGRFYPKAKAKAMGPVRALLARIVV